MSQSTVSAQTHREVGYVAGVHGLRGELVVRPHHAASETLQSAHRMTLLAPNGRTCEGNVVGRRALNKGLAVQLDCIRTRSEAESWKSSTVWLSHTELGPLEDGEFYLEDIRGYTAVRPGGEVLGNITGFMWTNIDIAVIRAPGGGELLIPLIEGVIGRVDDTARTVELDVAEEDTAEEK